MLSNFNLLATCERGFEGGATSELWMFLREVGDEKPVVDRAPVRGLIVAKTSLDPEEAVLRLRGELARAPKDFRFLIRVLPVERVVAAALEEIRGAAQQLAARIGADESFRITVEKRRTSLGSREIIETVAAGIDRRVDLEHPDWVVLIEVVGKLTGLSLLRPESILNVHKERARLPVGG